MFCVIVVAIHCLPYMLFSSEHVVEVWLGRLYDSCYLMHVNKGDCSTSSVAHSINNARPLQSPLFPVVQWQAMLQDNGCSPQLGRMKNSNNRASLWNSDRCVIWVRNELKLLEFEDCSLVQHNLTYFDSYYNTEFQMSLLTCTSLGLTFRRWVSRP